MKICVFNLGCKVNQYESDMLMQELSFSGFECVSTLQYADIYIINTCAVTNEAERKSRQAVQRCLSHNGEAKVIVCGCASQNNPSGFDAAGVHYIFGAKNKKAIIDYIKGLKSDGEDIGVPCEDFTADYDGFATPLQSTDRTRAYVKIQDGCNSFCTYCIIPYLRGRSRSRDEKEILVEIEALCQSTKEIVLTGINLMAYGKDSGTSLVSLLKKLKNVPIRLRLGSFYAEGLDEEMLQALFDIKGFCPHFHLSLQSGDNAVLKRMNRKYTAETYFKKIELIRRFDKNAAVTTDVIVGFPGETDEEFQNTLEFIDRAKFSDIHVFPFSMRKGTAAEKMKQLPKSVVTERKKILLAKKCELQKRYCNDNIGVVQSVLFEQEDEGGLKSGYSERYIKVYAASDAEEALILPKGLYKDGLKGETVEP